MVLGGDDVLLWVMSDEKADLNYVCTYIGGIGDMESMSTE